MVILVRAGADEADLVHRLRHLREQVADFETGDVGRNLGILAANLLHRAGLQVERVVMRQSAAEIDEQHRLSARRFALGRIGGCRDGFFPREQIGQRKPERRERANADEVAPRDAAAQRRAAVGERDVEHKPMIRGRVPSSSRAGGCHAPRPERKDRQTQTGR